MKSTPERLALAQAWSVCHGHLEALQDALSDMKGRQLTLSEREHLSSANRHLLEGTSKTIRSYFDRSALSLVDGLSMSGI
jgi:hypothetical protein